MRTLRNFAVQVVDVGPCGPRAEIAKATPGYEEIHAIPAARALAEEFPTGAIEERQVVLDLRHAGRVAAGGVQCNSRAALKTKKGADRSSYAPRIRRALSPRAPRRREGRNSPSLLRDVELSRYKRELCERGPPSCLCRHMDRTNLFRCRRAGPSDGHGPRPNHTPVRQESTVALAMPAQANLLRSRRA